VKKALWLLSVACLLFASDALLKNYVHYEILLSSSMMVYPYGGIGVFKDWHGIDFAIIHVINKGAAWGVFSSIQDYLLYVRVAIIGGLITYLIFVKSSNYRKWSLTLVTVGALGNVLDYFIYGHVVDMFYFVFWGYSYPVFNIADSAIFVGIFLMLAEAPFHKMRSKKSPSRSS